MGRSSPPEVNGSHGASKHVTWDDTRSRIIEVARHSHTGFE
ncbi:hypothetical protein [Nonomuraea sediminis]|nr:hypothetical protein [Nonomuraea sediminis]